ncbi:MAG: biopolymer transporter ExbD, partial [Planctomycetaceae bacterium]|nr:biopolymer transporter ExbD [Planctomycetaceae bacterium]
TPMVDVTFLLLIFFMITASFSLQKSIQVPPPNPDEDGVSQSLQTLDDFREESIIVEIDNNNGIYVDDTKLSNPSEIVQAILDRRDADGKPKSELVLSAHKAARHETVVAVVDAANEVGMQKIRLASYKGPED